jgi:hypothetical protein
MSDLAPSRHSLDVAYLPGVGWIEEPTLQHYERAINHLFTEYREHPLHRLKEYDARLELADRLAATYRRIAWSRSCRGR